MPDDPQNQTPQETLKDEENDQERPLAETPFVVEHRQEDRTPGGYHRPAARLVLTPALRTGGLWATLPPEDFKNLILMLTFLTPNGWCRPTLLEMAEAMRVSQGKARGRLQRLTGIEWRGQPLVAELPRPDGLAAFVPGRQLVAHEEVPPPEPVAPPPLRVAGRDAVIAHSRARYARTREEVEAQIGQMMGWAPPAFAGEDPAVAEGKGRAFVQMTNLGMPREQALDLLARFPLEAIERQLTWMPDRNAKQPARFLAAAIEGDYEMPPALRRRAVLAAALREQNEREDDQEPDGHENDAHPHQEGHDDTETERFEAMTAPAEQA